MTSGKWFALVGAVLTLALLCIVCAPDWAQSVMWKVWIVTLVAAAIRACMAPRDATEDEVDSDERALFQKERGRHSDESMLEYLDDKRARIGMPRRQGVNQDIVQALRRGSRRCTS